MGMKEMQNCRCLELEERVLKAEEKYIELETEMKKGKNEFESLELRFKELESEKLVIEEELRNLKESEEGSLIEQLMVNKTLEFEKQVAEKETEDWKTKFEKLVETVQKLDEIGVFRFGELELDENLKLGLELASIKLIKSESCQVNKSSGSPCITTPAKDILGRSSDDMSSRRRVNKMLTFEDDCHKSTDVVDLCDSDTEEISEKESDDAKDALEKRSVDENYEDKDVEACEVGTKTKDTLEERSAGENYEDEDVEACEVNTSSRKRKRVVNSDSENDDDDEDHIPISILKKLKLPKQEMPDLVDTPSTEENKSGRLRTKRRVSSRLRKQRVSEEITASSERNSTERLVGIPTTGNVEDDETEEELESESESLNGFIVSDDDDDSHKSVSENFDEVGEEESDGETGYADVMSRLRRNKKIKKMKWEYEADMLADFGKDIELCMRAVCVLYRFQSEDEKLSWSSHHSNGRGFSKFDAARGTRIGNFLTDGDPEGDLKKSVEELESFDREAVETCRGLADKYSKQLFQIYNNREDPFFTLPPSP
ncbi:hypothetical protein V5N11_027239 [Cardamine amara subsp. amara]|uniref:Uncharacterized protein n=1 Tax=Cardamine amara subsp. amara TaxID=228776 RepID=A0ABD1ATK0_CARAN